MSEPLPFLVPQADKLTDVVALVRFALKTPGVDLDAVATALGVSRRHVLYRAQAAELLGLIQRSDGELRATHSAADLADPAKPLGEVIQRGLRASELARVFPELLLPTEPDRHAIASRLESRLGLAHSTSLRRAFTLCSWHQQLHVDLASPAPRTQPSGPAAQRAPAQRSPMLNRVKKHDPSPVVSRVEELVRRVKEGDIKLPKFQRPYVWKHKGILALWDSVYRGYPIGSLLLWTTKQRLSAARNIGDLPVNERPEEYPTNYLLDGQQRLSTLCGALYWPGTDPKSLWNVAFDLREESFFHPQGPLEDWHFPLNRLLETRSYNTQCRRLELLQDGAELQEVADTLLSSVKDYKVAIVVLKDMEMNEVAPIFERINSTGRRLTIVDLMVAATWSGDFDLSDAIAQIKVAIAPKGFGTVSDKTILRSLSAANGNDITSDAIERLRAGDAPSLRAGVESTRNAYLRAVDFLHDDVGVPSSDFLPYSLQLIFLTEYFRICQAPKPAARAELRRWFWRTSFSGFFRGANTAVMTHHLSLIRDFAKGLVSTIEFEYRVDPMEFLSSRFSLRTAATKSYALLLAKAHPKSLLDGAPVRVQEALATANRAEFHHIFPRAFLQADDAMDQDTINKHANICLLNLENNRKIGATAPSKYLAEVRHQCGSHLPKILESNYISTPAFEAAERDDYEAFVVERCDTLTNEIEKLCGGLSRPGHPT